MGRAPCCDKTKVKRGPWSPEEDDTLKDYVHKYGTGGNWIALPHKAGLKRCGKSCRLRWLNYLRPDIKHGGFTEEEDNVILTLYTNIGSRWSVIASKLPGRTDNDVKNHWNTKLKKKLLARTTEPVIKNVPFMDSNKFALNNNMDFYSTTPLATFNAGHENFSTYSVMHSNTVPVPHSVEVIQGYPAPDMLYASSSMDQFPLPSLTEVQENDTPYDGLITTSSSREISSLSPSYSLAKSYASSWTENEIGEKMGFFEEFESRSSNYGHHHHHHHQNTQQEETVISSIEDDHSGLLGDYAYPMGSLLANISGNSPSQIDKLINKCKKCPLLGLTDIN